MSPRTRILAVVAVAAALAAGATVALAVLTKDERGGEPQAQGRPRPGAPPLVLDLGVREDPEAVALRRAERLYDQKRRAAAGRIFARYRSPESLVGSALAGWLDDGLARLERLASERPRSSLVLLHVGLARLWAGQDDRALAAWHAAARAEPDSPSAGRADDLLHPGFPRGQPLFVPSFSPPSAIGRLSPSGQLVAIARRARKPDVRAKLLYGLALQRLGHRLSARRQYDAAAALAPGNAEARVAAAVVRFEKGRPSAAFSRLGPLVRRFPRAPTVRFHLGLLLLWLARTQPGSVEEGKRQLRLARAAAPRSPLGREAGRLLTRLEGV